MAFDGLFLSALISEFKETILGGKIAKIIQSEKDELQITVKKEKQQYLLHLSANPSIPLIYLSNKGKTAPLTAPNFCMALRKHIGNGLIPWRRKDWRGYFFSISLIEMKWGTMASNTSL